MSISIAGIAADLRRTVRCRVLTPENAAFDTARRPWNLVVEQPVTAVVEPEDDGDVPAVVSYARLAGLSVATQPTGHGAIGDVDGVILLRTGRLDEITVDPASRLARSWLRG